jgi:hypothetical protein
MAQLAPQPQRRFFGLAIAPAFSCCENKELHRCGTALRKVCRNESGD